MIPKSLERHGSGTDFALKLQIKEQLFHETMHWFLGDHDQTHRAFKFVQGLKLRVLCQFRFVKVLQATKAGFGIAVWTLKYVITDVITNWAFKVIW